MPFGDRVELSRAGEEEIKRKGGVHVSGVGWGVFEWGGAGLWLNHHCLESVSANASVA